MPKTPLNLSVLRKIRDGLAKQLEERHPIVAGDPSNPRTLEQAKSGTAELNEKLAAEGMAPEGTAKIIPPESEILTKELPPAPPIEDFKFPHADESPEVKLTAEELAEILKQMKAGKVR